MKNLTVCITILVLAVAGIATAQIGSELKGRVISDNAPLPGVTVTINSPALQGQKIAVTNSQGDYIFKALPPGDYTVRFELASFATLTHEVRMSTSQPRALDAVMYLEAMEEEIVVTSSFETVSTGAQGSSTMDQKTLEKLPVQRNLESAVLMSAGATDTGPNNNITISGAQSWESLFTINGVVVNENIRGQARDLFIEDAILETTTITNNASAEYGRFGGGVVNTVTKAGGNEVSGSFRANVDNDSWNGKTPLTTSQVDDNNFIYEATLGGYILRDKLWFFAAGRQWSESGEDQIVTPGQPAAGIPYATSQDETRVEAKLTGSIGQNHRVMLSYFDIDSTYENFPNWPPAVDYAGLTSGETPETGLSVTYTGVLSDNFFVEALYSKREMTFVGGGGTNTELGGSPIWDYLESVTFNDAWFDAAGPDKERDNENYYAKASWFVSGAGTHDVVFGYDFFDDQNTENNRQMASGYAFVPFVPQNYDTPGSPLTVIEPYGAYIVWGDVLQESVGSHVETASLFVNDTWRVNDKLTVNLGVRYDKNDATDQAGMKTVDDSRLSPRLSASYDVKGDGSIIVNGGYNRYATAVTQNQGTAGSAAGEPVYNWYMYAGPEIIAGSAEYPTNADALDAAFDWFFNVYGGPYNLDLAYWISIPGVVPRVGENLRAPYGDEITVGASFRLGNRGVVRADYVHRDYGSFYSAETTPGNPVEVPNSGGEVVDDEVFINDDSVYERKYDAIMTRFDYRIGERWTVGANYTWSKAKGNFEGETYDSGPVTGGFFQYNEYKEASWNVPVGLLQIDQTHNFRGWVVWDAISTQRHSLSLSLLQNYFSGTPYSASAPVDVVDYVGDPADLGYVGWPGTATYFFSDRGAFRTETVTRTDFSINYSFYIDISDRQLEIFLQPEVTNLFNEHAITNPNNAVLTYRNDDSLEAFDPFTEAPVEGVNWRKGDSWGEAQSEVDYQVPRTIRFSLGIRF
jgi:hypothetical protein